MANLPFFFRAVFFARSKRIVLHLAPPLVAPVRRLCAPGLHTPPTLAFVAPGSRLRIMQLGLRDQGAAQARLSRRPPRFSRALLPVPVFFFLLARPCRPPSLLTTSAAKKRSKSRPSARSVPCSGARAAWPTGTASRWPRCVFCCPRVAFMEVRGGAPASHPPVCPPGQSPFSHVRLPHPILSHPMHTPRSPSWRCGHARGARASATAPTAAR